MWKASVINWITNIFGTIAGVPQLIEGYFSIQSGDLGHGIAKIAEGIGLLAIGYFVGKKGSEDSSSLPGTFRTIGMVLCLLSVPALAQAATVEWDRNSEADLKEYPVYTCVLVPPATTCTVVQSLASQIGVTPQSAVGVSPSFVLPQGQEGRVAVSARDTSGNESGLSVSVPFDSKSPSIPVNPHLKP
jgi:uncharacterized membrane protein YidH (DUF202 family)